MHLWCGAQSNPKALAMQAGGCLACVLSSREPAGGRSLRQEVLTPPTHAPSRQAPCLTPSHPLRPSPAPGKLAVSTLARALSQEESGLGVATPSPQAGRPQGPAAYASAPQRTLPRMLLSSVEESAPRSPCAPPGGGPGSDWAGTASPVGSSLVEDLDACPTPPFSNVFTPPWAAASPEARRGPALTGRPGADAAARIAAAMAHMGAATPHLAEALADIASAHGAGNALFEQTHVRRPLLGGVGGGR